MDVPAGVIMNLIQAIDNEGQRIRTIIDENTDEQVNQEREEYITFLDGLKRKLLAVVKVK